MTIESDIAREKSNIRILKERVGGIIIPQKSINFQFRRLRLGNRNQTQFAAIQKVRRLGFKRRIVSSRKRLANLKNQLADQQPSIPINGGV